MEPKKPVKVRSPAPALACGLELLEFIAHYYRPVSLEEFYRHFNWPKSSILRYLNVLCDKGYIKREPKGKLYSIASIVVKRLRKGTKPLIEIMTPEIVRLSEKTGKTVELIVQDDSGHTWLEKVEGRNEMLSVKAEVGFKRGYDEFDCLTRLYFAFAEAVPSNQTFFDSYRRKVPARTVQGQLDNVRKQRFAFDISGNTNGIRRYAAPIINSNHELIALIAIAEAAVVQNPVRDEQYKKLLLSICNKVMNKLN